MKKLLLFLFLIIIVSCKKETKKAIIEIPKVKKIDSTKIPVKIISGEPIKEFQKLVKEIEKDNWFSDTIRLKKKNLYSSLINGELKFFHNKPFYKIDFNDTELQNSYISLKKHRTYYGKYSDSLNIELVKKVKTIWGYFYRGKKIKNTIEDGVIEQWEFENEEIAKKAFIEIRSFSDMSYFNTRPYLFRERNLVFILHTRAMYFSYGQEKVYNKFKDLFSHN